MRSWTRRTMLGGALAGWAIVSNPALAQSNLKVPKGQFRLSRRLVRELSDGARIIVERAWEIRFSESGANLAVEGRQVNVQVATPKHLEQIASIERNRSTDGQFPILLGRDGMIRAIGGGSQEADIAKAIRMAEEMMVESGVANDERQRFSGYLSQIQASANSLFDQMPPDLFFPRNSGFNVTRPVNLPDGTRGEFSVHYSASADTETGLLQNATRKVVTQVAGTKQASSEHWKLAAI